MVKIIMHGCNGHMGQVISDIVEKDPDAEIVAGIAEGAQKNVNADWNAVEGDAQILNKPTQVSAFANDAHYLAYEDGVDTLVLNGGTIANPGA